MSIPVHASNYHSPKQFSSQVFPYLPSLKDSDLLPCSEGALCAVNVLSGQSTALGLSEWGLAPFLLLA